MRKLISTTYMLFLFCPHAFKKNNFEKLGKICMHQGMFACQRFFVKYHDVFSYIITCNLEKNKVKMALFQGKGGMLFKRVLRPQFSFISATITGDNSLKFA